MGDIADYYIDKNLSRMIGGRAFFADESIGDEYDNEIKDWLIENKTKSEIINLAAFGVYWEVTHKVDDSANFPQKRLKKIASILGYAYGSRGATSKQYWVLVNFASDFLEVTQKTHSDCFSPQDTFGKVQADYKRCQKDYLNSGGVAGGFLELIKQDVFSVKNND